MNEIYKIFFVRFFFLSVLFVITGCHTPQMQPRIIYERSGSTHVVVAPATTSPTMDNLEAVYPTAQAYCGKFGASAINLGSDSQYGGFTLHWRFRCEPIEKRATDIGMTSKDLINSNDANKLSISDAKTKCSDLGFKSGTEQFGKCVLQLSK